MKVSAKGMVVAGATAAAVLIAGWVFVFGAEESRDAATAKAAGAAADEASQTLEQRRQARLAQSQAMLGGGKPVPPEPAEAAAPTPAAEGSVPAAPPAAPERNPRPAATPVIAPLAPPPEQPCQVATTGSSLVAEACRRGGRPEAKQVMKRLVADARERGARYTCESCHADLDNYLLREDARAEFNALLENTR